jgi:hypothetical protein
MKGQELPKTYIVKLRFEWTKRTQWTIRQRGHWYDPEKKLWFYTTCYDEYSKGVRQSLSPYFYLNIR